MFQGRKPRIGIRFTAKMLSDLCGAANALTGTKETMQLDKKQQREICYYILAYLSDNPDAGDTFDGILQWWLLEQQIKFETRKVSEAVARLVSEELIVEREEPDSGVIYKLNHSKEAAIRVMLKEIKAAR